MLILFNIILAMLTKNIYTLGNEIEIPFNNFTISEKDYMDIEIELSPESETKAILQDIPAGIDFIVFQVHSYIHSLVLSYDRNLTTKNHVNGTNIGLYSRNTRSVFFYIINPHKFNVSSMIAIVPYTNESPIPGGCNMEFPTLIAPYLDIETTTSMIIVNAPPASLLMNCEMNPLAYIMFYSYLPQGNLVINSYFDSIRNMLTYPRVLKSSYVAPEPIEGPVLRRTFNKYNSVGSVYSFIAINKYGNVAAYTPAFLFPGDRFNDMECFSVAFKIELAVLLAVSTLICFGGHRYFLAELFFMGVIGSYIISYTLLLLQTSYSCDLMVMCTGIGLICGVIWMSIWWCVNSPVLSVTLSFLINGLLLASMAFFFGLGDLTIFQNDTNYWLTFMIMTVLTALISTTNPVKYNIFACGLIGSYGIIFPIDFYYGTNIKYILINVLRRATTEGFNLAIIKPPLQLADNIVCLGWIILMLLGIKCQKKLSSNRPPFPPVCYILRIQMPEATPILSSARFPSYS